MKSVYRMLLRTLRDRRPDVPSCTHSETIAGTQDNILMKCKDCRHRNVWPWTVLVTCSQCKECWHLECFPEPKRTRPKPQLEDYWGIVEPRVSKYDELFKSEKWVESMRPSKEMRFWDNDDDGDNARQTTEIPKKPKKKVTFMLPTDDDMTDNEHDEKRNKSQTAEVLMTDVTDCRSTVAANCGDNGTPRRPQVIIRSADKVRSDNPNPGASAIERDNRTVTDAARRFPDKTLFRTVARPQLPGVADRG